VNAQPKFSHNVALGDLGRLPTRTTVGVTLPGYDVEIDCIAVIPRSDTEQRA